MRRGEHCLVMLNAFPYDRSLIIVPSLTAVDRAA
jgi:hypothetical protein